MERGERSPHQEGMERGGEGGRAPHQEGTEGIGQLQLGVACERTRREIRGLAVDSSSVVKVLIRSLAAEELAVTAKFPQFSAGPALP